MSDLADELVLREMLPSDRNYVLSSWVRSYAGRAWPARGYSNIREFYTDYAPIVEALIDRSKVLIAALKDEPDAIVAWSVIEDDCVHYVLVKPRWRRLGVASWLLQDFAPLPLAYTHVTTDSRKCPVPSAWSYRRYRIWPRQAA